MTTLAILTLSIYINIENLFELVKWLPCYVIFGANDEGGWLTGCHIYFIVCVNDWEQGREAQNAQQRYVSRGGVGEWSHSVRQKQVHAWRDIMQSKINSLHIQNMYEIEWK